MISGALLLCMSQRNLAWTSGEAPLLSMLGTILESDGALPLPISRISLDKWWSFTSLYVSRKPSLDKWWSVAFFYVSNKPGLVVELFLFSCLKKPILDKIYVLNKAWTSGGA